MVGTAMKTFTVGALELNSMSHTWDTWEKREKHNREVRRETEQAQVVF